MSLDLELLRRIFGNLGAVQGTNFGRVGLVVPDCKVKKLTAELDDGTSAEYQIWAGQLEGAVPFAVPYRAAITNVGTIYEPDFILVLEIGHDMLLGFKMSIESDGSGFGEFMQKTNGEWMAISTLHKLNLATAFELIMQEGIFWMPIKDQADGLYTALESLIEN